MIVTQTPPPANRKHDRTGNFVKRARLTGEFAKIINDGLYYYEQVMVMLGKGCTGEACRYRRNKIRNWSNNNTSYTKNDAKYGQRKIWVSGPWSFYLKFWIFRTQFVAPDYRGNRTRDLWDASPMLCQLSYEIKSVRVCDISERSVCMSFDINAF